MLRLFFALFLSLATLGTAHSKPLRIVSWNVSPSLYEKMEERAAKFQAMRDELKPDVLVLIEVVGKEEVKRIIKALGWKKYHAVITSWSILSENVHFALEAAVVSRIPITKAIEYDAVRTDGHSEVFTEKGEVPGLVSEQPLNAEGIPLFGDSMRWTDRGTIRVDLANGLTIFPLHLKSNFNGQCKAVEDVLKGAKKSGLPAFQAATDFFDKGFPNATKERVSSAKKRERVMAAVVRVANEVIAKEKNRTVLLAGDFNTSYEPGVFGKEVKDCTVQDFTCAKGKFPKNGCVGNADGYDDTIGGILEAGLTGKTKWVVLTKKLGRTYEDKDAKDKGKPDPFANYAIDHFAVPVGMKDKFGTGDKGSETFGSDHFPIWVAYDAK